MVLSGAISYRIRLAVVASCLPEGDGWPPGPHGKHLWTLMEFFASSRGTSLHRLKYVSSLASGNDSIIENLAAEPS
jgi:hypothetical protein